MESSPWIVWVFLSLSYICQLSGFTFEEADECGRKESCSDCIRTPNCYWCSEPDETSKFQTRCFNRNSVDNICGDAYINDQWSNSTIERDEELRKGDQDKNIDPIQIKPQEIKLKLRVGETVPIEVTYSQAEDYPVDLYYLMDLSNSMKDDKENLSKLGSKLAEAMKRLTSNFRLGFGSFVDKPEMPFVSTVPKKLEHPCAGCASPYGFKNHLPLDSNTEKFAAEVRRAPISGNLDSPEGGFDAILQSMVCTEHIRWRQKARRLLVFSTDADFHLAGDGKLAGIVMPNDETCHLDSEGSYTHALEYDYPSIAQLNHQAQENNINLIFAVTRNQLDTYEELSKRISGASFGELDQSSSNVVKLVEDQYNKLAESVVLEDTASNIIELRYYSQCLTNVNRETRECKNLRVNNTVTFRVDVKLLACPQNANEWREKFQIKPQGLDESIEVEVEMVCSCDCEDPEKSTDYVQNSSACGGDGDFSCGICQCKEDYVGKKCECNRASLNELDSEDSCRRFNDSDEICSTFGKCKCGVCECEPRKDPNERIYGKFCECNNYSCDRDRGLVCSGPDHGKCECGKCMCLRGWTGSDCKCPANNETCIKPGEDDVCSARGQCECGSCQCDKENGFQYSGAYCEDCPTCAAKCDELRDCVECLVYQTGRLNEIECERDCLDVNITEKFPEKSDPNEQDCSYPDNFGCTFTFRYKNIEGGNTLVWALKEKECGADIDVLGLVLAVIGAIVFIGVILLLVWKLITTIHDKREYIKFDNERKKAKWDVDGNPLYVPSTSTFSNPMYSKQ